MLRVSRKPVAVSAPARRFPPLEDGYAPRHDVRRDPPGVAPRAVDAALDQLDSFACAMEARWRVSLGPLRVVQCGYDTLLGCIPGLGDAFVLAGHVFTNARARSLRVGRWRRGRIAWNSAVDVLVGALPLVGGAFNAAFAANRRNVNIILRHYGRVPAMQPTLAGGAAANAPTPEDLADAGAPGGGEGAPWVEEEAAGAGGGAGGRVPAASGGGCGDALHMAPGLATPQEPGRVAPPPHR